MWLKLKEWLRNHQEMKEKSYVVSGLMSHVKDLKFFFWHMSYNTWFKYEFPTLFALKQDRYVFNPITRISGPVCLGALKCNHMQASLQLIK